MWEQIIAIDPGTDKHGVAVVDKNSTCLFRQVIPNEIVKVCLEGLVKEYPHSRLVIGNGTGSKAIKTMLEGSGLLAERELVVVDEYRTTDVARQLYLKEHRTGWRKLVPLGLQTPPEPIDHYVAEVLAKKYLMGLDKKSPTV